MLSADRPQREVAEQLGLTIKALEARLIRARRQLRDVLNGALRDEADALDLLPMAEPSWSWKETRRWCHRCGRHRLRGIFEPMPDGRVNLCIRCPACSPLTDVDVVYSGGTIAMDDCHTFKPAIKRIHHIMYPYHCDGLRRGEHRCMACGRTIRVRIVAGDAVPLRARRHEYFVVEACQCSHDAIATAAGIARHGDPVIAQFETEHPRWIGEPDVLTEYQGQPAFRFSMVDIANSSRCTYFAHAQTLAMLAVFVESR